MDSPFEELLESYTYCEEEPCACDPEDEDQYLCSCKVCFCHMPCPYGICDDCRNGAHQG